MTDLIDSLRKTARAGCFIAVLSLSSNVFSADQCSSIDCDCKALPLESWQAVCVNHQTNLKRNCAESIRGARTAYCSVHGPAANRLPFDTHLSRVDVLSEKEIKPMNSQIAAMYWSVHADLNFVKSRVKKQKFDEATEMLRIIDSNVDSLFKVQRQVGNSWAAHKQKEKSTSAWSHYSEDTLDAANDYYSYADALWNTREKTGDELAQKELKLLTYRVLRVAGKLFEQAGYAFSRADAHLDAAQAWKRSANTSMDLIKYKADASAITEDVSYYELQAAARLHRASYHAVTGKGAKQAIDSLNESMELTPAPGLSKVVTELVEMDQTNPQKYYAEK